MARYEKRSQKANGTSKSGWKHPSQEKGIAAAALLLRKCIFDEKRIVFIDFFAAFASH